MVEYRKMRSTTEKRFIFKRSAASEYKDLEQFHYLKYNGVVVLVDFRCECGMIITLVKPRHTVKDGIVNPSVGHTACGFHEWVILEDWDK